MVLKLFDYLDRYLTDKSFKVSIEGKFMHILNYVEIEDFSNSRIVVRYEEGILLVLGSDLVISKMQDEELLITGKIKSIEYN